MVIQMSTYERTPDDDAKADKRRQKREAREQAKIEKTAAALREAEYKAMVAKAQPALTSLGMMRSLGVVGLEGSDTGYFVRGLEACVEKSRGRIAVLGAQGTIQGEDFDAAKETEALTEISRLRRAKGVVGSRVLAFVDFDFRDVESAGASTVTERVLAIIEHPEEYSGLNVLVVGQGEYNDLPLSTRSGGSQHQVAKALALHFGLDAHNKLSVAPELHAPAQDFDAESLTSFAHLLPGSINSRTA